MKALEVKEDGLIYAVEVPEEPIKPGSWAHQEFFTEYYEDMAKYREALAAAKDSAIRVSDQDAAWRLIFPQPEMQKMCCFNFDPIENWVSYREGNQHWGRSVKPGIYPIPDLSWEVVGMDETGNSNCSDDNVVQEVAILKESTPSDHIADVGKMVIPSTEPKFDLLRDQEQYDMWWEVLGLMDDVSGKPEPLIPELMKQFTITRKP